MTIQELKTKCDEKDGIYKFSTCDHYNWDTRQHAEMIKLKHSSYLQGYRLTYQINFGVHDWTIIKIN